MRRPPISNCQPGPVSASRPSCSSTSSRPLQRKFQRGRARRVAHQRVGRQQRKAVHRPALRHAQPLKPRPAEILDGGEEGGGEEVEREITRYSSLLTLTVTTWYGLISPRTWLPVTSSGCWFSSSRLVRQAAWTGKPQVSVNGAALALGLVQAHDHARRHLRRA